MATPSQSPYDWVKHIEKFLNDPFLQKNFNKFIKRRFQQIYMEVKVEKIKKVYELND